MKHVNKLTKIGGAIAVSGLLAVTMLPSAHAQQGSPITDCPNASMMEHCTGGAHHGRRMDNQGHMYQGKRMHQGKHMHKYGRSSMQDHDSAREALASGKVLPLSEILSKVSTEYPGDPINIKFKQNQDSYVYKVVILQESGEVAKLRVDATNGEIIESVTRKTRKQR